MKSGRFFLVALLLVALLLCSSCAKNKVEVIKPIASFEEILNKDYAPEVTLTKKAELCEELVGSSFTDGKGEFLIFNKSDENNRVVSKVFSGRNKRVILTVSSSETEAVEIFLYSNAPCFIVSRTSLKDGSFTSVRELYDATGTLVAQSNSPDAEPIAFADVFLFDKTVYSVDNSTGALTKGEAIPENLYFEECRDWNGEYFYTYGTAVNVYDRSFNHVYSWSIPSYAESFSGNMLNNGNVIVQYSQLLDPNTETYDFYENDPETGSVNKYKLHTVLLDPLAKTEAELDFKYVIDYLSCGTELIDKSGDGNMYASTVENVAYLYPFSDGQIDYSESKADVVLLGNDGKIKNSLKLIESQRASIPVLLGDGIYLASTVYGMALVDIKGEVLHQINNLNIDTTPKNIITDGSVYTLNMEKVYALADNNADVITYMNNTVFVKVGGDEEYSVLAIKGTEKRDVCSYSASNPESLYFEELSNSSCYALCNAVEGKYSYYNSEGEKLLETDVRLEILSSFEEFGVSVYTSSIDGENEYYIFS